MKKRPLIAIVGSVDFSRNNYKTPVRNAEEAKIAARTLGKILANKGYRILVYSGDSKYIERHVVDGFVNTGIQIPKSIVVAFALGQIDQVREFPKYKTHHHLFDLRQHQRRQWRIPYIQSFGEADGIILIGGGAWTLTAGSCAIAFRRPLLTLSAYGGEAEDVWNYIVPDEHLCTKEDKDAMVFPGNEEQYVEKWVQSLDRQFAKAGSEKRNPGNSAKEFFYLLFALFLVIMWILTLPIADTLILKDQEWGKTVFKFILFLAPLLAGASGATIRLIFDSNINESPLRKTVLGVTAGAVTALLYVLPQILTNPSPYSVYILGFTVIFAFLAGLSSDTVLKKLLTKEVTLELPNTEENE